MSDTLLKQKANFGTAPVFMTAISTILGAILYLRFGYAVAHTGFIGAIAIIIIGHLVTIPTALAVAEIATNRKVQGGGAYYIISRSFGLNIGAAIGIALFLSQAISVAFYVIAFAEAFIPFSEFLIESYPFFADYSTFLLDKQLIGIIMMIFLSILMLTKGANIGMNLLYYVVAILFASLIMFFMGKPIEGHNLADVDFFSSISSPDSFFYVFTIIFPAFTGIAAGLGLSGDLKDPKTSIPKGTLLATAVGIIVYVAVALKLVLSASLDDLASDQLIMSRIAIWGPIIPIGLGCAAISSALGSVMVAPRTLQALGVDKIFPTLTLNTWLSRNKKGTIEPMNASLISCIIAFFFVVIGDINLVAEVIAMFFMVTYGAICLISLLEHFSADPSYRPTFKSRWYISLLGAVLSFWLMFKMNATYALASVVFMALIYIYISKYNTSRGGIIKLFKGVLFQLSRQLQIFVRKKEYNSADDHWRPFAICISDITLQNRDAFDFMRWVSHKYGFGTYMHFIEGYLNKESHLQSQKTLTKLHRLAEGSKSKVYLDTIISPSYTSAIAQVIQLASISGKGHNLIVLEFDRGNTSKLEQIIKNHHLLTATDLDVCILSSSFRSFGYNREIHIWISADDYQDSNLEILLGYILLGHENWKDATIKIFSIYTEGTIENQKERLLNLIQKGRLPISPSNVNLIERDPSVAVKLIINEHSASADFTMIGFDEEVLERQGTEYFEGYDKLGNILFVNSMNKKEIK
jgi:solute carrier family 12 (sodium/potassium/chloride transporter), member 2